MENIDNGSVPSDGAMEQDIDVSNTVTVLQAVNRPETGEKAPDKSDAMESDTIVKTESGENLDTHSNVCVDQTVIEKLTYGVMAAVLPTLQNSQTTLTEVIENQRILMETLQQENTKFRECSDFLEVKKLMANAKLYQNKLLSIKKDMIMLHEKSAKLKKRALKLQQQKQKQILLEEQAHERELDREQQLVAKLSSANR
ncbi:hypothetical protein LSH36_432g02055 [Paralvinella palmiformis]|uniref:BLOC-1 subunit 6 n=1 Tax=Paralvinella palmiformis TaxID=53620 RepID=A0AAD9JC02_9ANNE|nr:hypothetical protein LSH36_432g02055 [Paralvinella palmiformis]